MNDLSGGIRARELEELRAAVREGRLKPSPAVIAPFVQADDATMVKRILERGLHAKALVAGVPLIVLAAEMDAARVLKVLLQAGAEADARARGGDSALLIAARRGCAKGVSVLLAAGAGCEARARADGATPLIAAAAARDAASIRLLAAAGAKLEARSEAGATALLAAVLAHPGVEPEAAVLATVKALLAAGASPHARDGHGHTALDHARALGLVSTERALMAATGRRRPSSTP